MVNRVERFSHVSPFDDRVAALRFLLLAAVSKRMPQWPAGIRSRPRQNSARPGEPGREAMERPGMTVGCSGSVKSTVVTVPNSRRVKTAMEPSVETVPSGDGNPLILFTAQESSALPTLAETQAVAAEVHEDLQQLKPNAILESIKSWTPGLLSLAYRLFVAALIIFIGSRIALYISHFLKKTFDRMGMDLSLSKFLISLANAITYAIVIFMALEKIGVPSASIIALLGSATLAIGLSLQGSLANFAGGILILVMRPFGIHDYIVCEGTEGTVQNIGLVYTTLVTVDNRKITIPNGSLSNAVITNVTAQPKRRVDLTVGIGYTSDLKKAKEILKQIYANDPLIIKEDGITVYVDELADSSVVLGARGWTNTSDYWTVRWRILEQIKLQFDQAGIEIPFNQLDVNVKKF